MDHHANVPAVLFSVFLRHSDCVNLLLKRKLAHEELELTPVQNNNNNNNKYQSGEVETFDNFACRDEGALVPADRTGVFPLLYNEPRGLRGSGVPKVLLRS